MRKSHTALIITSLTSMLFFQSQANAADVRRFCYKITSGYTEAYIRGDVFRQALLVSTNNKWNAARALNTITPPPDATHCQGATTTPAVGPQRNNYLGNISNKQKFLSMAAMTCGAGATISNQYFSIGNAIYYRNCNAGPQVGYIHFWGMPNGTKSQCFGSTYPEMFAIASPNNNPATPAKMLAIYDNTGSPPMASQSDYALGNAMAAIQIAESARDYLVYPINYMLIEQKKAAEQIIGGHCPPSAPSGTCQNSTVAQNGAHPLAWGGAQDAMMTGGWGTNNGATSEYGAGFEAETIVNWLAFKKLTEREKLPNNGISKCPIVQQFSNLPASEQKTVTGFFAPVFN